MPSRSGINNAVQEYWDYVDVIKTATGTASITVPAKSAVLLCFAQIITPYDSGTSASLIVGDNGGTTNGFLTAWDVKGGSANDVKGFDPTECGAHLYDSTKKSLFGKYFAAGCTIDATVTISGATTAGQVRVWVKIAKLYQD